MNVLRLFLSDQTITRKNLLIAIGSLTWFGVATNGLFELWKLLPTLFMEGPLIPDWRSLFLYLFPFASFVCVIIFYVCPKILSLMSATPIGRGKPDSVAPHKGVVLALSTPRKPHQDIVTAIKDSTEPDKLYSEWSIGQLFKGIYYHKGFLKHVWPLTTGDSEPFRGCIEEFVKKYMPGVKVCKDSKMCHLDSNPEQSEFEMIEMTKAKLSEIYSAENLNTLNLKRSDIIVDVTGGTKSISIGLTFGALDSATDIQYVEQKNYGVIPLAITPEIVMDKMGEYLLELYARLREAKSKS
ncbi:MAG: hypothetical protein ABSG91_21020 [Syntrophobacteraceae bacterium]|jgi:hypothetical protein